MGYYLTFAFDKECKNSIILMEGTLEEIDKFTSQFKSSVDVRKKFKKEIDNKTILNYIIKADYITVNVGYNDLKSIINESEIYLYDDIDSIIIDLDELFKLLRMYSKEKIEFIKIETDSNIDDYVNSRVEKLCNKYNIIYIY